MNDTLSKLGFVCWVIFFTDYTMVNHHFSPPFGRICCMLSNHLEQIQVTNDIHWGEITPTSRASGKPIYWKAIYIYPLIGVTIQSISGRDPPCMHMDDWMTSLEDISMFIAFHDDTVHPFYLWNNIYNLQHIDGSVTCRIFGLYSLELRKV